MEQTMELRMISQILVLLMVADLSQGHPVNPVEGVTVSCPDDDWLQWENHCYYFVTTATTWTEAEKYCVNAGLSSHQASLASLHSHTENEMLVSEMNRRDMDVAWLGLHRNGTGSTARGEQAFSLHDSYSALTGILDPGSNDPWDADGVDTFYFGGGNSYSREWCEYMCHMHPACAAYTWYSYHPTHNNWDRTCVGRSDRWDVLQQDVYAQSGVKPYTGNNGNVFTWSDTSHVTYLRWTSGQPDGALTGDYCSMIKADRSSLDYGRWSDQPCTDQLPFICKASPTAIVNDTDQQQPQYKILLRGTFYSSTGGSFSTECSLQYVSSMNTKALQMGALINSRLGDEICPTMPSSDLTVISSSSPMIFDFNRGETDPTFYLQVGPYLTENEIESCAQDIEFFVRPHDNWGEPILPTIPGCPGVIFYSSFFTHIEDKWTCINTISEEKMKQQFSVSHSNDTASRTSLNTMRNDNTTASHASPNGAADNSLTYGVGHIGQLRTDTGQDLDTDCTNSYSTELYRKTTDQLQMVNSMIQQGVLCAGSPGITVIGVSAYISVSGSEGVSVQDYVLQPSDGDIVFTDVYSCANDVSQYLSLHDNWIQPIIPQFPGCPALDFSPDEFQEFFKNWICSP